MFLDPKYNMSCNGPRKMELWGWKRFKQIENDEFTKTSKLGHSSLKSLTVTKPQNCTAHIISSKSFLECYTNSHLLFFFNPQPVHGFDVARYTEPGVSKGMKTTAFMARSPTSGTDDEEAEAKSTRRETSLRRKVPKRPIQKLPVREQRQ